MPRNVIGEAPFAVRTLDTDGPVTIDQITTAIRGQRGVSLCVRSANGPANRGGYFFHIKPSKGGYLVCDFEKIPVDTFDGNTLARFVNHVSGRHFDNDMLLYCQSVVNFRQDQTDDETDS